MRKCYLAIPHEENGPIVAPLHFWTLNLPRFFKPGNLLVDDTPGGEYKVSSARAAIVRRFLKTECDWLWMVDADMDPWVNGLKPNPAGVPLVIEAMERDDVDVLTGFFFRMGGEDKGPIPSVAHRNGRDTVMREVFAKPPGLHHVPGLTAGGACLAVKRHVFEDFLAKKVLWFRDEWEESDPENWNALRTSEDTWFFYNAQELGHRIWIDTRLAWGHIKPIDMRDEARRARRLVGIR